MEEAKVRSRRRHAAQLKKQVLAECAVPGASVARVALAHGLNANLVHKWRRGANGPSANVAAGIAGSFVAVTVPSAQARVPKSDIRIELRRGAMAVNVAWPHDGAAECAAWLREILR